ncbi:hypothetical protein TSUD_363880 [Trifolium subterraneum]|uniref:F-box domain-containing protein n=1 Tax=Trifolium subterraneum TaxID=3900 RepID=A0A2Z6P5H7_TRISU|nr:hypothetical protein TSUD_363880 [Trifolium subterraneum]
MAKNTALLRRKLPKLSLTSPLGRRKQRIRRPDRTLTSRIRRRIQPEPTLTVLSLHIPLDLVAEILCRLSVKQLTQLRCVCKSWNSLISKDSNFAKKQLRLSTSCQGRHHLFLKSDNQFLHLQCPISTIFISKDATMSIYSLKEGRSGGGYVSTCDGILCYKIDNSSVLLFNPSIRSKFIILPSLKFPDQGFVQISYTLVYDRFINNHKVIALNVLSTKREVNVHILGTDYWTRIPDFLPIPRSSELLGSREGIFVSDSVNWLVSDFIVSLDLEKESYQKLSLPVSVSHQLGTYSYFDNLGKLRGCLSLHFNGKCFADLWIMKEFGNDKSWTKLLTLPYSKAWGACHVNKVLYISEDDQVLMEIFARFPMEYQPKHKLVVYDSINNTFQVPEFQKKIHHGMVPEVYVESLISPF